MAAIALSLIGALMLGALLWLWLGERFSLGSETNNDFVNILAYAAMVFPFAFLFVALILPRL